MGSALPPAPVRPLDLIRLQTLLACRVDGDGRLSAFPWGDPAEVPRLELLRYDGGYAVFWRADLPEPAQRAARTIEPARAFNAPEALAPDLARALPVPAVRERRYHFRDPPNGAPEGPVSHVGDHFVVVDGSRPVAWAWTAREHRLAREVRVGQVRDGRRGPEVRRALLAWLHNTQRMGKVGFFRHSTSDQRARRMALDLGGVELARGLVFG